MKIDAVRVGERFRIEYEGIAELAESMSSVGQISPIIVDEKNNLVCGGRRILAARMLEWKEIKAVTVIVGNDLAGKRMQLDENLQRRKFKWYELACARAAYYKQANEELGYSQSKVGHIFGVTQSTVATDIKLAHWLEKDPALVNFTRNQAQEKIADLEGLDEEAVLKETMGDGYVDSLRDEAMKDTLEMLSDKVGGD